MSQDTHTFQNFVELPDSLKAIPKATNLGATDINVVIDVTLRLQRGKSIEEALQSGVRLTREQYEQEYGTPEAAIALVENFAHSYGLTTVEVSKARRSLVLKGKVRDFEEAFKMHLSDYRDEQGNVYRGRTGYIYIPSELVGIVESVHGLDNRPHARAMFQAVMHDSGTFAPHTGGTSYAPNEIGTIYGFPTGVTGKGQCIAIIELGGGFRQADLTKYFKGLSVHSPVVKAISVDNAHNSPSNPNSADGEVMLDIEVAGAIAPDATIAVYFAPNTDQGFLDAITTAIHDNVNKPSVISISWGAAEKNWTSQSMSSFNEAFKSASVLGVTICAASGDAGSSDGENDNKVHVDFPASSPYVLACGGTKLVAQNHKVVSEVVWHAASDSATGGGVSEFFPLPDYQKNAKVPVSLNSSKFKGRGVPDVAGNADPATGYKVLVDGQQLVIGGTSAVAPLYAGLIALLNQQKGKTVGYINPAIYATAGLCRDIVSGNNVTTANHLGYTAAAGWDPCTGLGILSKL